MPASRSLPRTKPRPNVGPTLSLPGAPGLSTAHNGPQISGPRLSTARNGSFCKLSFGDKQTPTRAGGGLRGDITEFSRASRRRLLTVLNSIDREAATMPVLITLTYPRSWPEDPQTWKHHLKAFRKRLQRKYGDFAALWRLEFQKRGAPHFHLLCFIDSYELANLREECSVDWFEVCGEIHPDHLKAGVRVEVPRSWRGINYLAKYMAKLETLLPGCRPGRLWGVWRKNLLPISHERYPIGMRDAIRLRRILRNYSHRRSTSELRSMNVFLGYRTSLRLLSWFGYYAE